MSKFHPLPVASVARETRDAVALTFAVPDALRDTFRFVQGQHLTLRAEIDGQDVRRSYSICSAVQDGTLRVAIKRAPGGFFSAWANARIGPGQNVEVMAPVGDFKVSVDPNERKEFLAFSRGHRDQPGFCYPQA